MGHTGPIKMGFIGYGRAAVQQHAKELESFSEQFRVVAVSVRSSDRQEAARATYGCAIYGDYRELLRDPEVELVDITTPSIDHAPMAIAALDADRHVFLEKPIAVSYAEAKALQEAAGRSRGKLLVRHNRRFFSDYVQMKEIIDSGRLGNVFLIRMRCLKFDLRDDWQTLKARGGGLLLNMGPHFIDHCLGFLGWKYTSLWADLKLVAATGDAEDHIKIIFKGGGNLLIDLELSGGAAFDEVSIWAYGKHGAAACDGKTIRLKYYDPAKVTSRVASGATANPNAPFGSSTAIPWVEKTVPVRPPQRYIWNDVFRAIREGAEYPITVEQSVQVMKVIDEAKAVAGGPCRMI